MIYVFDALPSFSDEHYYRILPFLSAERRLKAEQFRFMGGKKLSAAVYLLLAYGLEREYGLRGPFDFSFNEYGKPALKNYPHIHFNMSHCTHGAVCAVSDRELGLDIQEISHFNAALVRRVCSDKEFSKIRESKDADQDFCRLWVQKESVLKLQGTGINDDLKQVLDHTNTRSFFYSLSSGQTPCIICCSFFSEPLVSQRPKLHRVKCFCPVL